MLLNLIVKKRAFLKMVENFIMLDPKMYRHVSKESLSHIRWFLSMDKFNSDGRKRKIVEEK